MSAALAPVIAPEALRGRLGSEALLIVDLGNPDAFARGHVPGAVNLAYASLVTSRPPVGGLLPDDEALSEVLSRIGLTAAHAVVAYDDEGGGRAGRLLWTLDVLGHQGLTLLDGGMPAWLAEGHPLESGARAPARSAYRASAGEGGRADLAYIRERLGADDVALLDTRSEAEYAGTDVRAARGGHIPGAVSFDWVRAMDMGRARRLKPAAELRAMLEALGITPDKEIIAYCQTHHRSSHTYWMLRSLGYSRIRGYPGAWSEWGNAPDTPVE